MDSEIASILERYKSPGREKLLPILLDIQQEIGYLPEEAVIMVGKHLKIPASKVFGVATFYNSLRFEPKGKFHIKICNGSNCHLEGSIHIINELKKILKINEYETTPEGIFSFEVTSCLGGCAQSPVIQVNDEYYTKVTPGKIKEIIANLKNIEE